MPVVVKPCRHAKVEHFGSSGTKHEDIVAGEISMNDTIGMKIGQSQGDVVTNSKLSGKGKGSLGSAQELSQTLVQRFH